MGKHAKQVSTCKLKIYKIWWVASPPAGLYMAVRGRYVLDAKLLGWCCYCPPLHKKRGVLAKDSPIHPGTFGLQGSSSKGWLKAAALSTTPASCHL
eukprot:1142803-Pelagomonas_calceolata.AAC.3